MSEKATIARALHVGIHGLALSKIVDVEVVAILAIRFDTDGFYTVVILR